MTARDHHGEPRRRRRQVLQTVAVVSIVVATALALGSCGAEPTSEVAGRAITTTAPEGTEPFSMAGASGGERQTTIPQTWFERGQTRPTAPPTTGTTLPLEPLIPANGDPVCEGAVVLGEMLRKAPEFDDDVAFVREYVVDQMRIAADRFAAAGGEYQLITDVLTERAIVVEGTTQLQEVADLVVPLLQLTDPALQPIVPVVTAHLRETCPSVAPR